MFAFNYLRSVFDADEPAVCLLRLKPNVEAVTPPRDGGEQRRHESKVIIPYYGRKASEKTRVGIVRGREGCYNLLGGDGGDERGERMVFRHNRILHN